MAFENTGSLRKFTFTAYIKITLDDANNPTTAEVEYHFDWNCPENADVSLPTNNMAIYKGTLKKVTSSGSQF